MPANFETSFLIQRIPDADLIDRLKGIASDLGWSTAHLHLTYGGQNQPLTLNVPCSAEDSLLSKVRDTGATFFTKLELKDRESARNVIAVERSTNQAFDNVKLHLSYENNEGPGQTKKNQADCLDLALRIQTGLRDLAFHSLDVSKQLLGAGLSEFYTKREQTLQGLETHLQSLIRLHQEHLQKLNEEHLQQRNALEEGVAKRQLALDAMHEERMRKLQEENDALDRRAKEIDDRAHRAARREEGQQMRKAARTDKNVELSENTVSKRIPIKRTFLGSILCLLGFFIYSLYEVHVAITSSVAGVELGFVMVKSAVALSLTVGMVLMFIRWNDRWFREHAELEFRFRSQILDLDRANWVVEGALEWVEMDKEMPPALLENLSKNLFVDAKDATESTRADDLMSALLGPDSRINLNVPGGVSATIDRKKG